MNVTRRPHTLLVTLALPVVLVYAGYWFQKLDKEREERKKQEESHREERRRKEQAELEEKKRQEADRLK